MNPLILKYKECPPNQPTPKEVLEYSHELNLTVLKETGKPAIGLHLATETITKTAEVSDTDKDIYKNVLKYMETGTATLNPVETSDSDRGGNRAFMFLLATQTITENVEDTDSDK